MRETTLWWWASTGKATSVYSVMTSSVLVLLSNSPSWKPVFPLHVHMKGQGSLLPVWVIRPDTLPRGQQVK